MELFTKFFIIQYEIFTKKIEEHIPPIHQHWNLPILHFEILSLINWNFFPSLKPTGFFFQFKHDFFKSFWAKVKYFDGPCLTIYSLSTIYSYITSYYSHCYESKRWKTWKIHRCLLWYEILNYPNWDFWFC